MSILTVENMSHVFGGRVIYEDVSFKLNKGEHVGFIGANVPRYILKVWSTT